MEVLSGESLIWNVVKWNEEPAIDENLCEIK
jgi:hypothetical protein